MSGPIVLPRAPTVPPTTVIWPATLPQQPLVRDFRATEPVLTVRATMDNGPAKVRQRFTAGVTGITCHYIMTPSQIQDLRAFYNGPAGGGAVLWAWPGPPPYGTEQPVRFVNPPQWSPIDSGQVYDAQIEIEIIPPQISINQVAFRRGALEKILALGWTYEGDLRAAVSVQTG
jgi:hypothetical protein